VRITPGRLAIDAPGGLGVLKIHPNPLVSVGIRY